MYFQACGDYIPIDPLKMHFVEAKLIVYLLEIYLVLSQKIHI